MKSYNINQSPLYRINSHKKLSSILGLKNPSIISKIVLKSDKNYYLSAIDGRDIQVPLSQLRRIHKRIDRLLRRIEQPAYLYSGVKGRSNVLNAKSHNNNYNVLKIDIEKYYQSISKEQIYKCFRSSFRCSKDVSETLAKLCSYNDHMPTGSPVSLSLSTAVNRQVFDHINGYSGSRNIKFTCYVDDLVFSGKIIPLSFKNYIVNYLKKSRGYNCHKIINYNPSTPKVITGVVLTESGLKVMNKHRLVIYSLLKDKNNILKNNNKSDSITVDFYQKLIGHLFSAGQINGRYKQLGRELVIERILQSIPSCNTK